MYDYVGTAAVTGAYFTVELTQHNVRSATLTRPILLDRPARNWLVARTKHGREQAVMWADWLWYTSVAYPVVDAPVTSAIRTGGIGVSWNMTMMNIQSFALASLLIRMPHKWLGRTRPDSIGCAKDPTYSSHCGNDGMFASFPGGHVAVSMTGAALTCAHHVEGGLYGSPLADGTACSAALAVAATVGWLRMRSDSHWLSDQVVGTGIGLFSGFFVPTMLYYRPFWRRPSEVTAKAPSVSVAALPWIDEHTLGATFLLVN